MSEITISKKTFEVLAKRYLPDHEQVRQFISMLGDVTCSETFRVFDDAKPPNPKLARNLYGTYTNRSSSLSQAQKKGCGNFLVINQCNGQGGKDEHVVKVRAVFADFDNDAVWEVAAEDMPPHMRIRSSSKGVHLYWIVRGEFPLDDWKLIQQAIAKKYGSDPSVCNLSRPMRLPGTWWLKGEPYESHFEDCQAELPHYTCEEIKIWLKDELAATEQKPSKRRADTKHQQSRQFDFTDPDSGEVVSLEKWATLNRSFNIVTALREHAPHVIRGDLRDGRQHISCPFQSEHTDQSPDLSTFVANKVKGKAKSFVICCMHAHCAGRDRLEFLEAMLIHGWLPKTILGGLEETTQPPKVYYPVRAISLDPAWNTLEHDERRIALDLMRISYTVGEGTLPADDWLLHRYLGIPLDDWQRYRTTLTRMGWLLEFGDRLFNPLLKEEYDNALSAYNGWRTGGKNRSR